MLHCGVYTPLGAAVSRISVPIGHGNHLKYDMLNTQNLNAVTVTLLFAPHLHNDLMK